VVSVGKKSDAGVSLSGGRQLWEIWRSERAVSTRMGAHNLGRQFAGGYTGTQPWQPEALRSVIEGATGSQGGGSDHWS